MLDKDGEILTSTTYSSNEKPRFVVGLSRNNANIGSVFLYSRTKPVPVFAAIVGITFVTDKARVMRGACGGKRRRQEGRRGIGSADIEDCTRWWSFDAVLRIEGSGLKPR